MKKSQKTFSTEAKRSRKKKQVLVSSNLLPSSRRRPVVSISPAHFPRSEIPQMSDKFRRSHQTADKSSSPSSPCQESSALLTPRINPLNSCNSPVGHPSIAHYGVSSTSSTNAAYIAVRERAMMTPRALSGSYVFGEMGNLIQQDTSSSSVRKTRNNIQIQNRQLMGATDLVERYRTPPIITDYYNPANESESGSESFYDINRNDFRDEDIDYHSEDYLA